MHWKSRAILVHCLLKMSRFLWLRKKPIFKYAGQLLETYIFLKQIKQVLNRAWLHVHANADWNKINSCDKPHISLLFMCKCDFIWSRILFPCRKIQREQDQARRKSKAQGQRFFKSKYEWVIKKPPSVTQYTCVQFTIVLWGKGKKIPSPKSWKKVQLLILHITKFEFGKLITISLQRPIRNKPLSLRHKFEFQSLQLTQLINEFLNADCARRPSAAKPLGRSH